MSNFENHNAEELKQVKEHLDTCPECLKQNDVYCSIWKMKEAIKTNHYQKNLTLENLKAYAQKYHIELPEYDKLLIPYLIEKIKRYEERKNIDEGLFASVL